MAERGGIRTPGATRVYLGGIRPEFGALFGPKKGIGAGENLFAWGSAHFGSLRFPSFRETDARNPVTSNSRRGFGVRISPPRRAVSKCEPCCLLKGGSPFPPVRLKESRRAIYPDVPDALLPRAS